MIHLDLSPEVEKQVLTVAHARGLDPTAYAHQVLAEAVSADFYTSPKKPTPEEFRASLDRMAELGKDAPPLPPLSDYALTLDRSTRITTDRATALSRRHQRPPTTRLSRTHTALLVQIHHRPAGLERSST